MPPVEQGRQSDFYLLILKCPRAPTFLLYQLRALAFPQVSSSKKDKKLALDSKIPRRDFWDISDASTHRSRALGLILV